MGFIIAYIHGFKYNLQSWAQIKIKIIGPNIAINDGFENGLQSLVQMLLINHVFK